MKAALARIARVPERLGVRLAMLLSVALLPVGLIAVLQSISLMSEARARSEAALMGETLMIVQTELRLIQRAQGMAAAIAGSLPPAGPDAAPPAGCAPALERLQGQFTDYALVAVIAADGGVICASTGAPLTLAGSTVLEALMETPDPRLVLDPTGTLTPGAAPRSAIVISHPVTDPAPATGAEGETLAIVAVVLPHDALRGGDGFTALRRAPPLPEGHEAAILTFNAEGELLTSSLGLEGAQRFLPRDRALRALAGTEPLAFSAVSIAGGERVYSVVPLIEDELYALGTWPGEGHRIRALEALPAAVFPGLMWGASLIVAWLAAGRLVTRHIRKLRSSITAFAGGDRAVGELDVSGAPLEIRQLSDAFLRMTATLLHDEAELENAVHQKEVLLREVHHRVKNNLQLIASILNMQMRQARTPEAKGLMKGVRDRVLSLATIHRGLYQTTGLTDISADELLSDILRQLVSMATGPGRRLQIEQDLDPIRLTPDQAVPLSLFLTEALTNVMKYAGHDGPELPSLSVRLKRQADDKAILSLRNSIGARPPAAGGVEHGTGLGTQLLDAFAQQIGGHLTRTETPDSFELSLRFALSALTEAEARNAPAEPDHDA